MSKSKAVLFGLNYGYNPQMQLYGCVNDVKNMAAHLKTIGVTDCELYTDDTNRAGTSAAGIVNRLTKLASESYSQNLEFVWIHYSGHGTFIQDRNGDEKDGRDECIVPSDVLTKGVITDDMINSILSKFNPKTRVICIFDCCHSGTICDLTYSWEGIQSRTNENPKCNTNARIVSISGCLDTEYSADTWDATRRMYAGAMTTELLNVLQSSIYVSRVKKTQKTVFTLITELRNRLKQKGFQQVPKLTSSYNLASAPFL